MNDEGYNPSFLDFNNDGQVNAKDLATPQAIGVGALVFGAVYFFVSRSKNKTIVKLINEKKRAMRWARSKGSSAYRYARRRYNSYRKRY